MLKFVDKFLLDDLGATTLEYGIIAALVSTAIITTILAMGVSVDELYQAIAFNFDGAVQ